MQDYKEASTTHRGNILIDNEEMGGKVRNISHTASVLVPAFNAGKYLSRALDSVLNQTYKDFEIILIDDGSTDSTSQICDEYGEKYPFIHAYHQKNMGILKTRAELVKKANGKYVFWLDQDDYLEPTLLEKAVKAFESSNADIVTWGIVDLTTHGEISTNPIEALGVEQWKKQKMFGTCRVVVLFLYATKRALWNGWDESSEDVDLIDDLWISSQIVTKAEKIVSLGEHLYYYDKTNLNSASSVATLKYLYRGAATYYKILKKNLELYPNIQPLNLEHTRVQLMNAYCINQVDQALSKDQTNHIKMMLRDLYHLFPMNKKKKSYLVHFCILHGIDFICRWYGKGRIKKLGLKLIG